MEDIEKLADPKHRRTRWGNWYLDGDTLVYQGKSKQPDVLHGDGDFYFDAGGLLEEIDRHTSRLSNKPEDLGFLLLAVHDIFDGFAIFNENSNDLGALLKARARSVRLATLLNVGR
jgi:hypothetical protein